MVAGCGECKVVVSPLRTCGAWWGAAKHAVCCVTCSAVVHAPQVRRGHPGDVRERGFMPSIDFKALFKLVGLRDVLTLLGYCRGHFSVIRERGPCPLQCTDNPRSCRLNCEGGWWYCFRCKKGGKPFKLYMDATRKDAYSAAVDLCNRLGIPVPYLGRTRHRRGKADESGDDDLDDG